MKKPITPNKSGGKKPASSGQGTVRPTTLHVYQAPAAKVGERVLFFPGKHDTAFDTKKIDRYSATVSNDLGEGVLNLHVLNDGPDTQYRTNIFHRSTARKGESSWEHQD